MPDTISGGSGIGYVPRCLPNSSPPAPPRSSRVTPLRMPVSASDLTAASADAVAKLMRSALRTG